MTGQDVPESAGSDVIETTRLRRTLDTAGLGTWEWDAASGAVRWDEQLERQFGLAPGGFAGTVDAWVSQVFVPDRDEAISELERAVAAKGSFCLEHRVQRPDGTLGWVESRGAVVLDPEGRVTGLAGVCLDVTDRHQRQEQRDRERWQAASDAAEDGHRRMALLAEVTGTLAATLDVDAVLDKLARLVVPRLADLCTVDLVDLPGVPPRLLAVAAITPRLAELLRVTDHYLPRRRNPLTMIGQALATGEPVLAPKVTEEHLRRISVSAEQARAYLDMELVSGLVVPLIARGQVLGALSMFTTRASGRVYEADVVELMTELARRAALSVDNARMFTREHEAAETLQRSLLPDLPDLPDLDVAARYLPAAAHAGVGGDLFDLFALPDGATAIAIGDVMGHDMQAAAAMGQLRSVLRSYAWEGASPGVVLDRMDQLVQSFEMAQLASALYARLEPGAGGRCRVLRYSNAGHLPPLLQHPDGTARFLEDGQSVLIGVPGGHTRFEGVEPMPRGSTLLLYTDGLLEIGHRPLEPGLDQLLAMMRAHDPAAGAEALCGEVLAGIEGQELVDDAALLAVRLL
jgi:PAS domain S-box-containing protein